MVKQESAITDLRGYDERTKKRRRVRRVDVDLLIEWLGRREVSHISFPGFHY